MIKAIVLTGLMSSLAIADVLGTTGEPAARKSGSSDGVVYEIEVTLRKVMARPYFAFEFQIHSAVVDGERKVDLAGQGSFHFKGTDEELQARLQVGSHATIRGDCDNVVAEPIPAEGRVVSRDQASSRDNRWYAGELALSRNIIGRLCRA